ncbi:hypothetical protein ACFLUD_00865 [Chloroflexota bacterium]
MWRSKKLIIGVVLAAVLLAGSIGGVALAADNGDDSQPEARYGALLDRVCEIYQEKTGVAIDQEALKDAFAQIQGEIREAALESHLQYLVDEGQITQDEADEYQIWLESRPDVLIGPGMHGFGGGMRGMGGMRGFGGLCAPTE